MSCVVLDHSWSIPIEKLMIWRAGSWVLIEHKSRLQVYYDQLIIMNNASKVLESINMRGKIKGVFKDDILILIFSTAGRGLQKVKFQIKYAMPKFIEKLEQFFPIMSHVSVRNERLKFRYRDINEILKNTIENNDKSIPFILTENHRNFVKLCLLDPEFPQVIMETQAIIDQIKSN